jgi:RNA polymerase sigma-B factor
MALTAARSGLSTRDSLHLTETRRLWQLRGSGGAPVREELVRRFLPLARKVAMRYVGATEPRDDLVQVAHLGLIGAVQRFEPERGNSFAAFAVPTMIGEIKRHFRKNGWAVHVPRGSQELALEVRRGSKKLSRALGRAPRVLELAQYLEREVDEVLTGLEIASVQYAASLDASVVEPSRTAVVLADTLGAEDGGYSLVDAAATLRAEIPRLPYHERRALILRFTEGLTQVEIAERLGCSQMQVSRLIRRGRDTLRDVLLGGERDCAPGGGTPARRAS